MVEKASSATSKETELSYLFLRLWGEHFAFPTKVVLDFGLPFLGETFLALSPNFLQVKLLTLTFPVMNIYSLGLTSLIGYFLGTSEARYLY